MAYIGLRKPIIGKLDTETGKYSAPFAFGKAIGLQVTPSYAEGALNADDVQAEYDKVFNYADVTLNTSTIPIQAHHDMFGHTVETETGKSIEFNANDENNYVGMGWITVEKVDGVRSYKTPSITGRALAMEDGKWKSVGIFDTEAAALEWINGQFGVTA